jgi:hypothetical protein
MLACSGICKDVAIVVYRSNWDLYMCSFMQAEIVNYRIGSGTESVDGAHAVYADVGL